MSLPKHVYNTSREPSNERLEDVTISFSLC